MRPSWAIKRSSFFRSSTKTSPRTFVKRIMALDDPPYPDCSQCRLMRDLEQRRGSIHRKAETGALARQGGSQRDLPRHLVVEAHRDRASRHQIIVGQRVAQAPDVAVLG